MASPWIAALRSVALNVPDLATAETFYTRVWQLSVGEQQRVEILKLLYRDTELLILDEPTAVLTPQEAEELGHALRRMADEGKAVIFITHKLDEVMRFADRVTVLRGGQVSSTHDTVHTSKSALAREMVGREVLFRLDKEPVQPGALILSTREVHALGDKGLPALREWLTRKQKETLRGRAELVLTERAAAWAQRPGTHTLPSLWEWLNIVLFAPRHVKSHPDLHRRLLNAARRHYAGRIVAACLLLALLVWGAQVQRARSDAQAMVVALRTASTHDVPRIIAYLQDQRLRVSSRRHLDEALIATGIPYMGHGDFAQWTRIFGAIAPEVAGIRRFGSAALDLAWVAAGRYDGFWESDLQPWDVAAGMLLVREAGGFVTDFRGGDRAMERKEFLAANDGLHSKLHKLLAGALR